MSERWARAVLTTYRWAGAAVYPVVGTIMASRAEKGAAEKARRRERYGHARQPRPDGPIVWVHAAGEGETAAVTALVDSILAYGIGVVFTTGSTASATLATERLGDRVIHQYVPLDVKPAVSRFLDHWQPDLAIMAESEIWPMTILELSARRVPHVLVNGRMSDRAFASWTKRHNIAEALFENFALVVTQSETDAERFLALGARPVKVGGKLKMDPTSPPCDEAELSRLQVLLAGRPCWTALRTMPGEEAAIAEAHKMLRTRYPELLTVVAPADPARGDEVEQLLATGGMIVARRDRRDKIGAKTDFLIGDARSETGLLARMGEIVFAGGSLCAAGGQNPLDAVSCGCAVLTGENIDYHRDIFEPLIDRGAVKLVKDPAMLAGAVNFLLKNGKSRKAMVEAGASALRDMRGALARTLRELDPYIHPLVVKARLEEARAVRR